MGIKEAKGNIIVRIDAHSIYPSNYISVLVDLLRIEDVDNVGGIVETLPADKTTKSQCIAIASSHKFGVGDSHFRIGSKEIRKVDTVPFGCFKKEIFSEVGLFDLDLTRNQDDEFNVHLIVADGLGDEIKNNVHIHDIGLRQSSLLRRARIDSNKAYQKALLLDSDVFHIHDPELTKIGVELKRKGFKVIYDAHEDLPKQIYGKPYLKSWMKPLVSKFVAFHENNAAKQFDYILTATRFIKDRFILINNNTSVINNYPILGELSDEVNWSDKKEEICYIGQITNIRGVKQLLEATELSSLDFKLNLVGGFSTPTYRNKLGNLLNNKKVNKLGFLNRVEVAEILKCSKIGVVTFLPLPNHVDAQPNKMFEYMSDVIPVISSNFPLWKQIIEGNNCGLTVDPKDPKQISSAIEKLLSNDKLAEEMGKNGRKTVEEVYNWGIEEKKLLNTYEEILK